MILSKSKKIIAALCCLSPLGLSACAEYDAPPDVTIIASESGGYEPGTALALKFSEKVDPTTINIKVWPPELNEEKEFDPSVKPLISKCNIDACETGLKVEIGQDQRTLWMSFDEGSLGKAGSSFLLDVQPGLADLEGNDTGVVKRFAVSFKSPNDGRVNDEPVPFDQGTYILVGEIDKPLPATLNLIADVKVREDGFFALAGAEGEEIEGAAKNTANPDELYVNTGKTGFAIFIPSGFVFYRDGERLLETDPIDVAVPLGFLDVSLKQVRLNGKIVRNPDTGKDRIESTLTFEGLDIIRRGNVTSYPAGAAPLVGDWTAPEKAPEGHPKICSDYCGVLMMSCDVPEVWPPEGFCP